MANKYLIHGATYCGDGTTSAEAASAGAAGAWNDINVLSGTAPAYGSLAAGDTVYIRSKDSGGGDLSVTIGINTSLGASAATYASPITWILDAGTIWSGISGTLTYLIASGNYTISVRNYNIVSSDVEDALIFRITYTSYYASWFLVGAGAIVANAWFDLNAVTFTNTGPSGIQANGNQNGPAQLINPKISLGNKLYSHLLSATIYSSLVVTTPRISIATGSSSTALFTTGGSGANVNIYGGYITGDTSGKILSAQTNTDGCIIFQGTAIPANMLYRSSNPTAPSADQRVDGWGVDNGVGSFSVRNGGVIDSRQDGYYPYLNGTYPNSSSQGWSWKITPSNASFSSLLDVPLHWLYTDNPAAKTITANLQIADAFDVAGTVHRGAVWLDVNYIDNSTGETKTVSTRLIGHTNALDVPSVTWSASTYGATLLQKKSLSVTTPTSIKKDTLISAFLRWSVKAVSSTDIAFVDPELVLS